MLKAFAGVARAPFLLLPVTLVAAGAAAGAYEGHFHGLRTFLALLGLTCLHAAVNIFNEVSDYRTGIDLHTTRTPFSGGSGTLPGRLLRPGAALAFGILNATVGLVIGAFFVRQIGWPLVPIVVVGAVAVLAYTDFLAKLYLGELFAGLGLGALPVLGAAVVQEGYLGIAAVWASVPAFCMTFNLLLLNEFPDEEADRAGGRRNLVILLGRAAAAHLYVALGSMVPISLAAGVVVGALPWPALAAIAPSLLLIKPARWAFAEPEAEVPHSALAANVAWNLLTNLMLAVAFVTSIFLRPG